MFDHMLKLDSSPYLKDQSGICPFLTLSIGVTDGPFGCYFMKRLLMNEILEEMRHNQKNGRLSTLIG